ncbi:GntR family transcriptional regulator [Bariatricus massiliensis]|uniref:GntR family transcriptional regulator n=1 Tax=Bariatricus massiliensis TaxID=1745713 RepID=A0ABS8DKL2_9FIRM|nr:GntR family transcriptional regulator [Bariatricus massiliensis]MCB7305842.1 GntR family transcriptional regulator [Bariatricus massiliensis]MCB7376405.1 GntR family transcriptional regulator [Bariatricus massiliensis]MCB7388985.1 GntR family transcriptional regulator [Bariatricus massiliensis]MCB7413158.1 GntR family transcriptional regulator [Bariatricus massiliensis]MCQ5255053.1 GntR family transcriptional regulator [Bariatricus massiliensis]
MKSKYRIVTLREQVNGFIKSRIVNGEIKPGQKINEFELAEELGISRGPVREALRQIEQEGLVLYEPNKGCTVTKLTVKEMYEMSLLRADLEILAVNVCEGKYSDDTIEEMEKHVARIDEYDRQKNLGKVIEEDQAIHALLVQEPNLPYLMKLWHILDGTNIAVYSTLDSIGLLCWGRIGRNHKELLECVKTRDIDIITNNLKLHYISVSEFVKKFIEGEDDHV